jgi:predicted Ser/Thr protein kinase
VVGPSHLDPGRIIAGRYRVESLIGQGGMGAVYLVRHVHTEESLALKLLHAHVLRDESAVERFRREARAPARVSSEHVARVTDADTAPELDNAPFYVMELLRGQDLEKLVAAEGPLPPRLVVEYLRQTARALDKAHGMGIVHRDLKPENLFLTHREDGSPCVKLLDFGIARLADDGANNPLKTQVGYVFGTPAYMSPEQALGEAARVGPATDIWSIGLVAFKLLTGKDYFAAPATPQVFAKVLSEPLVPASERGASFGASFDAWFAHCVNREIADRFATVGEALVALGDALGVGVASPSSSFSLVDAEESRPVAPAKTVNVAEFADDMPAGLPQASGKGKNWVWVGVGSLAAVAVFAVVYFAFVKPRPAPRSIAAVSTSAPAPSDAPRTEATTLALAPSTENAPAPAPLVAVDAGRPRSSSRSADAGAAKAAAVAMPAVAEPVDTGKLTREQRQRLESLQRLCDQRTFSPDECKNKRLAILRGP